MLVSFIIPHKGREEMLVQTIESIQSQSFDLASIEVIVVSQNESLDCAEHFNQLSFTTLLADNNLTISELRNLGAQQSSGEYLAFLDADVKLSNNWLSTMLELLEENKERKLVSAMQINGEAPPYLEQIRTVLSNAELDQNVSFLPGRNLFLSRNTFDAVGGFPAHLVTCEDYYFTDQVNQLGTLYYSSKANYVHLGEDKELKPMFQKEVWRGQSNLQSIKGRNIPLREVPSFLIPPAVMFGVLLFAIGLLIHNSLLSLFGLTIFLLPVLAYTFRLHSLAKGSIPFIEVLKFYLVYFPARAKGTFLGVIRTISVKEAYK
nr:glycosyltransferase family A protein [Thalassotalea eurytherma]